MKIGDGNGMDSEEKVRGGFMFTATCLQVMVCRGATHRKRSWCATPAALYTVSTTVQHLRL